MSTAPFNDFAHRMLTDEGSYTHEHAEESFEDVGFSSGPELIGGPAYDGYYGDSHVLVIDASGCIVHSEPRDFALELFFEGIEQQTKQHAQES